MQYSAYTKRILYYVKENNLRKNSSRKEIKKMIRVWEKKQKYKNGIRSTSK